MDPDEMAFTPLHIASINNDLPLLRILTHLPSALNAPDSLGRTPLWYGSAYGNISVCRLLVEAGAGVDVATDNGSTPLFMAARNGGGEICRFLLDNGAQVDHPYKDGVTPLSVASQNGHLPVCEILVNAGADVNAANAEGLTPVMIASIRGHVAVIQFLVDSSDRNILNGADDEGRLPMHQVCTFEDADPDPNVIKVLVRNHPRALIMTDGDGHTPEEAALLTSVSIHMNITGKRKDPDSPSIAANIPLLSSLTAAYTVGDFPTLISLCGGTSLRLERLHSLSLRATTVLCLERIMTTKAPLTLTLRLILTDEMTKKAIWLLASVYNREKGIVREIVSYLGSASD